MPILDPLRSLDVFRAPPRPDGEAERRFHYTSVEKEASAPGGWVIKSTLMTEHTGVTVGEGREEELPENADLQDAPLNIVFCDLYENPEDVRVWSGTLASIVQGLRESGQRVTTAWQTLPSLRRAISSLFWHYYVRLRGQHYIPDRHRMVTRFFAGLGNLRMGGALKTADAVITTSTTATGFLATDKPIFVIHDATWGQILELYPYFHPSLQVPSVVDDGFAMERATFRRSNVTLVLTSQWVAQRAIADYNLDPKRVHVLPLGANFATDPPHEAVERAIRARTGERCHLLFVGREFDRKGGEIAVEAARILREAGIETVLRVVGCNPAGLPPWAKVYGLLRKDVPEELARLQELYATSDIFILPTRAEAQGVVFNEAAAYGLPTVATAVGGVSEVVADGSWGHLLPLEANGDEYAHWIARVFCDRQCYLELALDARDDFERRLSRSCYTKHLLAIIRQTIGQSEPDRMSQ